MCDKEFVSKHSLKRHIQSVHERSFNFDCKTCGNQYKRKDILKKHEKIHIEGDDMKIKCKCGKIFTQQNNFFAHRCLTDPPFERKFKCGKCCKAYAYDYNRDRHQKECDKQPSKINCNSCSKQFKTKSSSTRHSQSIHNKKSYKCSVCREYFSRPDSLNRHLNKHKLKSTIECICGKIFYRKDDFNQHFCSPPKDENKQYECEKCKKIFAFKNSLEKHKSTCLKPEELDVFSCDKCRKTFMSGKALKRHQETMHNEKNQSFECDICGSIFNRKDNLSRHKKSHNMNIEQTFKCKCGKSFTRRDNFNRHFCLPPSKSDKKFKCDKCGRLYVLESSLMRHIKICTGVKKFDKQCVCGLRFSSEIWLSKHKKTCDNPGYRCGCGMRAISEWYLKKHESLCCNLYYGR